MAVSLSLSDVRNKAGLADYAGEVAGAVTLRITDRANGPSQAEVGTLGDYDLSFGVPCAPTADMLVGATCSMSTTADSLVPGIVTEGKRAIWGMGQVRVNDGGADGAASTMGDNTPFAVQGIFVP